MGGGGEGAYQVAQCKTGGWGGGRIKWHSVKRGGGGGGRRIKGHSVKRLRAHHCPHLVLSSQRVKEAKAENKDTIN